MKDTTYGSSGEKTAHASSLKGFADTNAMVSHVHNHPGCSVAPIRMVVTCARICAGMQQQRLPPDVLLAGFHANHARTIRKVNP
ncbi:hypothetical protein [Natronohydrobacter thiooxidans]|uniref:hypothetical protein n=1 Tax=Natronohydrobacter thiooxidans TaxID=87172 RepID=UPI0011147E05|nr:hypothetical protein [Natronohydrobacter thiooxidans]